MQITCLPHAVLLCLVRHPLAPVQLLVSYAEQVHVEHILKGWWDRNNGGIRLQHIHFLRTSIPRTCKLPYCGFLVQVSC